MTSSHQVFTIEEDLQSSVFKKFINNNGLPTWLGLTEEIGLKIQAFTHRTQKFTHGHAVLLDIQGNHFPALSDTDYRMYKNVFL